MCYGKTVVSRSVSYGQLFVTPWTAARQASLSFIVSQTSLNPMFIDSVMPSNHLVLCHPLLLLPLIFPSIRLFSNESALRIRWPRYWSFNFSVNPSNEYSGLISFRIDWFDLFAVKALSRVSSGTAAWKATWKVLSFLYGPALITIHDYCSKTVHTFNYSLAFKKYLTLELFL